MTLNEVVDRLDPFARLIMPHLPEYHRQTVMGTLLLKAAEQRIKNWESILNKMLTQEEQDTFYNALGNDKILQLMYLRSLPDIAELFQERDHLLVRLVLAVPYPRHIAIPEDKSLELRLGTIQNFSGSLKTLETDIAIDPVVAIRSALARELLRQDPEKALHSLVKRKQGSNDQFFKDQITKLESDYQAWISLDFRLADDTPILNQNFKNTGNPIQPYLYQRMDVYNFLQNNGWNIFYPTGKGKTAVPLWALPLYWDKLKQQHLPHYRRALVIGPPPVRETWYKAIVGENTNGSIDHSARLIDLPLNYSFVQGQNPSLAQLEADFMSSNIFFTSHFNLRRKIKGKLLIDYISAWGYDALIIDEIESVKSPRDKKIFAKDALVLAHKSTLHNPLVQVPISVLTPNPLADKVEDICMVATLCDRDKYPTVNHARSALNEGGIQKAFYILREKGTPLAEDIGEKIPPKLKYIIPIMPSKNIYLINRYILRNRRRIPNWLTQVRHLYSNPNLVDERLVVNVLGEYKFQLDDMRKTLALIDILTHTSPYVNPLERGEKCVIFSPYFRDGILTHGEQDTPLVLELLQSAIKSRYGDSQQVVPIHGNIDDYRDIHSIGEREKLFHLLANSPKHNVGFITSEVGGVSKDLSAANNIFVYDPPIAVYVENQLEGRGWRTGQKLPVNIYTLLMQDPLYDRSRIHDLDDTVDIESCFVVPYLNARFLATSPRATMSVDEATFALVRAKDIILRYGFHGVLPDESLVDLLEGKKQRLMLPTREEDFTLSRREQELIATGGISFAHRSIEDALGNSPDHYFITAGVPLPEDRPVFEPQSSGIKPQETIVSAVLIDPTGQELKIIDTTSTAVLPIKHTAKKPTKRKKAAEAPIELKHILPEPEIIVLPTEVRPLKESESRELVPVQPTYGQLSPRSLADMSRQQIYDAVTAVFGGARTPEEFLRRRILDLDKFMQGLPKYEDINALARHIYKQRGGNILSDDLQNIVYKAMDRLNIKRSNTEIRRLYNAAKVASYYKQMGYHDITWAALERVYRSTPKAIKINAFSRACMDWGEDSSNLRKLPDPPEMFAEGQHPVHEMLLTLAAPYIDVIHTHTVKIIETFRDSVTYGKQTRGHRLISGLKYLPNL